MKIQTFIFKPGSKWLILRKNDQATRKTNTGSATGTGRGPEGPSCPPPLPSPWQTVSVTAAAMFTSSLRINVPLYHRLGQRAGNRGKPAGPIRAGPGFGWAEGHEYPPGHAGGPEKRVFPDWRKMEKGRRSWS